MDQQRAGFWPNHSNAVLWKGELEGLFPRLYPMAPPASPLNTKHFHSICTSPEPVSSQISWTKSKSCDTLNCLVQLRPFLRRCYQSVQALLVRFKNSSISQSQRFSNGSPGATASAFPGNLLEMPFPRPNPAPAESKPPR